MSFARKMLDHDIERQAFTHPKNEILSLPAAFRGQTHCPRATYGKGLECYFLKSTFCPLLGVLTYSSIKFGSCIGIEK